MEFESNWVPAKVMLNDSEVGINVRQLRRQVRCVICPGPDRDLLALDRIFAMSHSQGPPGTLDLVRDLNKQLSMTQGLATQSVAPSSYRIVPAS